MCFELSLGQGVCVFGKATGLDVPAEDGGVDGLKLILQVYGDIDQEVWGRGAFDLWNCLVGRKERLPPVKKIYIIIK